MIANDGNDMNCEDRQKSTTTQATAVRSQHLTPQWGVRATPLGVKEQTKVLEATRLQPMSTATP